MWYQIVSAIVNVGLAWQDQYMSNKINKKLYNTAAKTAEINAKMEEANLARRSGYRNEELGQQVWNIRQQANELIGRQSAAMGASGFDVSTGDQRILEDSVRRSLEEESGLNRSYYLQQYEDELQVRNDVLQYNFEAYANRQMAKYYSGINGLFKIVDAGGRAFVNSASSNLFANPKGGISSNTGAGNTGWMTQGTQMAQAAGKSGFGSNNLSLGNYSNFAGSMKF